MQPNLKNRIFDYTRLAFWLGLIATMYVCVSLINVSTLNTSLRDNADRLEEDNLKIQSDIDILNAQVAYYKTDEFKERQAREKLGLQAPGEQVVIVGRGDSEQGKSSDIGSELTARIPQQSHLEEWLGFLFGTN
ncbi:MAG: septum formation initiator family protein [bacterium]